MDYAACLIGRGSEVLGYDDEISTDHHWGPRLQIFLKQEDYDKYNHQIKDYFSKNLPQAFLGYSTNWSEPDPDDSMNQFLESKEIGPINHRIEIHTVKQYLKDSLGLDSLELNEIDWLITPEQRLLEFTSGSVFYDNVGELTNARKHLSYYPDSIWKLKIIVQWNRISQEMAFVGRTGGIGDDLGSRIEASRLVKYIIEMAFILEKKYIPYEKWFTVAFKRLNLANSLEPIILDILKESKWQQREKLLCDAYLELIKKQIDLNLIPNIDIKPIQFYNRPQIIVPVQKVVTEIIAKIKQPLNDIAHKVGSVNQFIDISNNIDINLLRKARCFYE
ncbi:MAG: DUF4037 domain-containing protein [Promethearchaeota archaeon]